MLKQIFNKDWGIVTSQREQLAEEKKRLDDRIAKLDEMSTDLQEAISAVNKLLGKKSSNTPPK